MTRSELINELVLRNPCFSQNVIEDAVRLMLDRITEALADGDKIEIRGFGSLTVRKRRARSGRNPSTGKIVEIGETKVVNFRTGRELRERVDISNHPEAAESLEKAKRLRSERAVKSAERRAKRRDADGDPSASGMYGAFDADRPRPGRPRKKSSLSSADSE